MPPTGTTRSRSSKRDGISQITAKVEKIATQNGTEETMFIVRCDRCGQKHRHRTAGLRVSGCKKGLYRLVVAV
jgi:hypothetical protein